jgi:hypothetical protein
VLNTPPLRGETVSWRPSSPSSFPGRRRAPRPRVPAEPDRGAHGARSAARAGASGALGGRAGGGDAAAPAAPERRRHLGRSRRGIAWRLRAQARARPGKRGGLRLGDRAGETGATARGLGTEPGVAGRGSTAACRRGRAALRGAGAGPAAQRVTAAGRGVCGVRGSPGSGAAERGRCECVQVPAAAAGRGREQVWEGGGRGVQGCKFRGEPAVVALGLFVKDLARCSSGDAQPCNVEDKAGDVPWEKARGIYDTNVRREWSSVRNTTAHTLQKAMPEKQFLVCKWTRQMRLN